MPRVHQAKQSLFSRWMHQHARQIISGRQKFVVGNLFLAEMTNLVSGMWQIMSAQNALLEIREFLWSERWSLTLRKSRRYFLLKNIPKYCTRSVPPAHWGSDVHLCVERRLLRDRSCSWRLFRLRTTGARPANLCSHKWFLRGNSQRLPVAAMLAFPRFCSFLARILLVFLSNFPYYLKNRA